MLSPGRGLRGAALAKWPARRWRASGRLLPRLGRRRDRHRHARHRARAAAGPDQRRSRLGQQPLGMAVGSVAHTGDGPAVHRQRGRAAALPRPARAGAGARPRASRAPLRSRDAGAQQALAEERWDDAWLGVARAGDGRAWRAIAEARERDRRGARRALGGGARGPVRPRRASRSKAGAGADLAAALSANRTRDAAAGRATEGPHRQDLAVVHRAKQMPAAQLVDRRAEGAAARPGPRPCRSRGRAPRRAADPAPRRGRRASRSEAASGAVRASRGRGQVWMTATEAALFDGIGTASRFHVEPGQIAAD